MRVPFILPDRLSDILSRPFSIPMAYLAKLFPETSGALELSEIKMKDVEYLRKALINAFFVGIILGFSFYLFAFRMKVSDSILFFGSIFFGVALFFGYFFYLVIFPNWLIVKRSQEIDEYLIFAMRHISVQVSAGVPVFDAIQSASTGYGAVSKEFRKIVTNVNGGQDFADAIDESAEKSPSTYYRRIMWQLSNSTRSGYAIKDILKELVDFLTDDQKTRLKKFGSELNVISIFYLSTAIILPTLGLIFVIIASSFGVVSPNTAVLSMFVFLITLFNLIFLGLIKSKRPRGIM
ncbi:MAG: type II secretion system F family protein [Candidatus Micrarchaeota archaeon]